MTASTLLREIPRMALADLAAHPMRTALSVASFSFSLTITVVLVAVGGGLKTAVHSALRSLGEGQISMQPGQTTGLGGQRRAGRRVQLRYDEVEGIARSLPSYSGVAPYYTVRGGGASSWRYSIPWSPVQAVGYDYQVVRGAPVTEGRWFTRKEAEGGDWVAVLNHGLRRVLFPQTEAVGRWVEWRGRRMKVVGVLQDEASFPYYLFVPYRAARQIRDARYISGLVARPKEDASWDQAVAELRRVLAGLGGFDPADEQALEIEDNRDFTARVKTGITALQLLVWTIGGVCLLLGGLGVANMMVISVTERTREVGVRKALGATSRDIFTHVLFEALTVAFAGGVVGIVLGATVCGTLGEIPLSEKYVATVRFDLTVAMVSVAALALVAVFAGLIPARRAAALSAAEALRWE